MNSYIKTFGGGLRLIFMTIITGLVVFALLPLTALADEGQGHGHEETAVFAPIGEDDFIGDGHTDHIHEGSFKEVWYKNQMWWILFLISVFLLTLLSLWVRKLIEVEDPRR